MIVSLDIPDELYDEIHKLSLETGRSPDFYMLTAINEYIGDLYDLAIAQQRDADLNNGLSETYTLEEVMKQNDL